MSGVYGWLPMGYTLQPFIPGPMFCTICFQHLDHESENCPQKNDEILLKRRKKFMFEVRPGDPWEIDRSTEPKEEDGPFELTVNIIGNNIIPDKTIIVEVECSDTVSKLKSKIQEKTGILPDKQRLFRRHFELREESTLYRFHKGSSVDLELSGHTARVEKETSGIGSCEYEKPAKASFGLKVYLQIFGIITIVDVDTSVTIREVKDKIQMEESIHSNLQMLFYGNLELVDSNTLSDYSIGEGSTVKLLFRRMNRNILSGYNKRKRPTVDLDDRQISDHISHMETETSGVRSCEDKKPGNGSFGLKVYFQYFNTTIIVDVDTSVTIRDVKDKIQMDECIDPNLQVLFYDDLMLVDSNTLSDYSIGEGSTVKLLLSSRRMDRDRLFWYNQIKRSTVDLDDRCHFDTQISNHISHMETEISGVRSCEDKKPGNGSFGLKVYSENFETTSIVNVDASLTICEVKDKILTKIGFETYNQRLFYGDSELLDSNTLSDYSIGEGSTIKLLLREPVYSNEHIIQRILQENPGLDYRDIYA